MSFKELYTPEGWINFDYLIDSEYPFVVMVGGRCTGKTYGAFKWAHEHPEIKCLYMRRTISQIQTLSDVTMSPYYAYAEDNGIEFDVKTVSKNVYGIYTGEGNTPEITMVALAAMAGMRSFNGRQYKILFYDEAIPETSERLIKCEGDAIWNAYNTVDREREVLTGEKALKMLIMGNSMNILNPVYISLGIVNDAYNMIQYGISEKKIPERKLHLVNLWKSPKSETYRKSGKSALNALLAGNGLANMMYNNQYLQKPNFTPASRNLKEYKPVVTIGEITIYVHKSRMGDYYVSPHGMGTRQILTSSTIDLKKARALYCLMPECYNRGYITFENPAVEALFITYFGY